MQEISLEIVKDQVKVKTPYNEEFVNKCRNLRGKFSSGCWWFDDSIIDYVREAMITYFGTTGETPYENCSLLIRVNWDYTDKGPYVLFGRIIARAYGRDTGAKLGDGIIFIKGSYNSGGSMKNWRTEISDATFIIKDFPVPSLELPEVKKAIEEEWCEVQYSKKKRSIEDIQSDIERCKKTLEELEKELSDVQPDSSAITD